MGTMKSFFFLTGQTDMKIGQKMSIGVLYWTLIEEFWKGVILPPNRHFRVVLTSLHVTGLQEVAFFDLAKHFHVLDEAPVVCAPRIGFFMRLTIMVLWVAIPTFSPVGNFRVSF